MADSKQNQGAFSLRKLPKVIKGSLFDLLKDIQRFLASVVAIVSAGTDFVSAFFMAIINAYQGITGLIFYVVSLLRRVVYFDYKGCFVWSITLPIEYYRRCKEETKKCLWLPVTDLLRRKMTRSSRAFHARLHEIAIYAKGLRELCRRLFLLASDYTPGGKITVTIFLLLVSFVFVLKIVTFVGVLLQIAQVVYTIASFLLHPLFLTLQDILSMFDPVLQALYILVRIILHACVSTFKGIGTFIWLNVVSISSGLYRSWQSFAKSTAVQFVWKTAWKILADTSYLLSEKFVFVFLPFMSKASYYLAALSVDLSSVAYQNFFVVTVTVGDKFEYFTLSGLGGSILILWATLLTFRFRNTLSGTFFSEIDDKEYAITRTCATADRKRRTSQSKAAKNDTTLRFLGRKKDTDKGVHPASEDDTDGHIHYSSQVPICINYISGICHHDNRCSSHHCSLPYHWQYRLSLEGWKSFNAQENRRMEELFCDPRNDIVTTPEIEFEFKSYGRERVTASHRKYSVNVDFENMKIEKTYQRADLRRLSTESFVNGKAGESTSLLTQWVWYRQEESGEWAEYEAKNASDATQEDLETAFLSRNGNFNFTRDGQEFRLQFFLNPMCEKSFRPYSRKIVRRRPRFNSPENIQLLTRGKATKTSWFRIRGLFWWC